MSGKRAKALFLVILFLALLVRMMGLDRSFVLDEFRTIGFASKPLSEILDSIKVDSYPPLSYLALHVWLKVSSNDIWIRLLFVLFGLLSVAVVYILAKEAFGHRCAHLTMFLGAFMPMQVWVSQYVRGIAPAILFLLLSTLFFLKVLRSRSPREHNLNTAWYLAASCLAIYSFYFSFLVIITQNLCMVCLNRRDIRKIMKWLFPQLLLAALFLPWLGGFLSQLKGANIIMNFSATHKAGLKFFDLPLGLYLRGAAGMMGADQAFLAGIPVSERLAGRSNAIVILLVLAAVLAAFYFLARIAAAFIRSDKRSDNMASGKRALILFLALALGPFLMSIIANIAFKTPVTPRYFAVSSAFLLFVYAFALSSVKSGRLLFCISAIFIAASLIRATDFAAGGIDYKNSARFIERNIKDGECLLLVRGDAAYAYYARLPKNYIGSARYLLSYGSGGARTAKDVVDEDVLKASLKPFRIVWLYHSGERLSGTVEYVAEALGRLGYEVEAFYIFKDIEVAKYAKKK
jgi:uncharacterized membrane protein